MNASVCNGFTLMNQYVLAQNGEQVSETDGSGNWAHTNVFAGNQLIATYNTAGLHFQLSDWLGTRRVETDYAGNTQETCTNLPFGDGASNCTAPTEQFFTGYQRDTESGNDYAQARYYASNMGRFITPDPYNGSYDLNNPQSFNRYAYVNGIGGNSGKVVGDSLAVVGAALCVAQVPGACLGYAIYTIGNDLFSVFWDLFDGSGPKFTGSLEPRPGVPGIQGNSSFGVPVDNLPVQGLPGTKRTVTIPFPGLVHP